MHAYCVEWMAHVLRPGARILDIGSGSGVMLALFYELTKKSDGTAHVYGIEHLQELADFGNTNLNHP